MTGRIALGTAQFGLAYGVANTSGRIGKEETRAILVRAAEAGVDTLDTAIAYGESEALLGSVGVQGLRIITKLPPLPEGLEDCETWVREQVTGSLRRLKVARLEALLLHQPADLLGPHGPSCRNALRNVKEVGFVHAVGISIYRPDELDALWPCFRPDLVQAPFNVFDRRIESSGWLERLADAGVRVHTRSAFLQGLLLMAPEKRPAYFEPWSALLRHWDDWCRKTGAPPLAAALGFCLRNPGIERVVVGVDSLVQLEEILSSAALNVPRPPAALACEERALIEPPQWKL